MNIDGKSKDTNNARLDLTNLNVCLELHMVKDGNKWIKPATEFTILVVNQQKLLTHNRNDVAPEVILDNMIKSSHQPTNDDDLITYVVDEDKTLEDYFDNELGEDDSETDKESTGDEHNEYYSETNNDLLYYYHGCINFCTF